MEKNFDRSSAIYLAELNRMKEEKKLRGKGNLIIDFLKKTYEDEIKKVLSKNYDERKAEIVIPKHLRVYGEKQGKIIESMIKKEFNLLGFCVTLHNETCGCVFDCLCNRNGYKVIITWY
jgi:hypothetical protein